MAQAHTSERACAMSRFTINSFFMSSYEKTGDECSCYKVRDECYKVKWRDKDNIRRETKAKDKDIQ